MSSEDGKKTAAEAISAITGLNEGIVDAMSAITRLNTYCSFYMRGDTNDGISANDNDKCKYILDKFMGGYDPRTMSGGEYEKFMTSSVSYPGCNCSFGGDYGPSRYCPSLTNKKDIDGELKAGNITYSWITKTLPIYCDSNINIGGFYPYFINDDDDDDDDDDKIMIIGTLFCIYLFDKSDKYLNEINSSDNDTVDPKDIFRKMMSYYVKNYITWNVNKDYLKDLYGEEKYEYLDIIFKSNTYGKIKKNLEEKIFNTSIGLNELIEAFYEADSEPYTEDSETHGFVVKDEDCVKKFGRYIAGNSFMSEQDKETYDELNEKYLEFECDIWDVLCGMNAVQICANIIDGQFIINDEGKITIDQTMQCVQMIDGHNNDGDSDDNLRPNNKPTPTNEDTDDEKNEKDEEKKEEDNGAKTLMVVIIILAVIIIIGMIGLMIYLGVSNSKSERDIESDIEDYSSE